MINSGDHQGVHQDDCPTAMAAKALEGASWVQSSPLQCGHSLRGALMQESNHPFSEAFGKAVDLGNRIADTDDKADIWDIADGLLAGAVQYWLYSRQPCADPNCEECIAISTADGRLEELRKLMRQFAAESEYFHSPTDRNVGRA
jgi:hypothetical protein